MPMQREKLLEALKKQVTLEVSRQVFKMLQTHQGTISKIKKGEKGEKGDRGDNGQDGQGLPGRDAEPITEAQILVAVTNILEQNPQILSQAGEDIVKAINNLPITPDKQIDARHIKGLPQASVALGSIHRGGLKIIWNQKLQGDVDGVNTVFTLPATQPDPKDDKFIVSVRGVLKTADAGDFTTSNSNRTLTFTSAPPNGSDSPRIIIYHGK